jgi:hypothetical protein
VEDTDEAAEAEEEVQEAVEDDEEDSSLGTGVDSPPAPILIINNSTAPQYIVVPSLGLATTVTENPPAIGPVGMIIGNMDLEIRTLDIA